MTKDSKVLITGHETFLGKRTQTIMQQTGINIATSEVDYRNFRDVLDYFRAERPDIVVDCQIDSGGIHYVQTRPGEIFYNNTLTSLNLQEAARIVGIKKFINLISNSTYPVHERRELVESEWWDGSLHESVLVIGMVRKHSWVNAYAYHKQYGMKYTNLIIPNIYGPEDYFDEVRSYAMGALIGKIMEAKLKNLNQVIVWGTGRPKRDWVYVDDLVEAVIRAIEVDTGIDPINIGSGQGVSIAEIAKLIKRTAGFEGELVFDTAKPDGAPYKVMNIKHCKQILNWQPRTTIQEGIKKTVEWYLANM